MCCNVLQLAPRASSVGEDGKVCCSVLPCVTVCCSVLQFAQQASSVGEEGTVWGIVLHMNESCHI